VAVPHRQHWPQEQQNMAVTVAVDADPATIMVATAKSERACRKNKKSGVAAPAPASSD